MTKRQIISRVRYLRSLYAELDTMADSPAAPKLARERAKIAANHGKAMVAAMLDAWQDANPNAQS